MKGIIFTELLEMVEEEFGLAIANRVVKAAAPANGGAYTAVGTYDHEELLTLVTALSNVTGVADSELQRLFGHRLFQRFTESYAVFFKGIRDAFEFLERIDSYVHVEVHKLYPEAELPRFYSQRIGDVRLILDYESSRPFANLAQGLIEACIRFYGTPIDLQHESIETGHRTRSRFTLTTIEA